MGHLLEHRLDGLGEVAAYGPDGQGRLFLVLCLAASEERVVALDQIEPLHLPLEGFFLGPVSGRDREIRRLEAAQPFLAIESEVSVLRTLWFVLQRFHPTYSVLTCGYPKQHFLERQSHPILCPRKRSILAGLPGSGLALQLQRMSRPRPKSF